ncbi:hypothetical protein [uncultured Microbacterium sp.]|uniref:hypothetical protein n=1 Tax=uncultured Microbacterium sp. TaxID=191216 RepID=UPI0025D951E3|nr:hypothetical protein [uncultured Microbacterium sp.]
MTSTAFTSTAPLRHRSTFVPTADAVSSSRLAAVVVWASVATCALSAAVVLPLVF